MSMHLSVLVSVGTTSAPIKLPLATGEVLTGFQDRRFISYFLFYNSSLEYTSLTTLGYTHVF